MRRGLQVRDPRGEPNPQLSFRGAVVVSCGLGWFERRPLNGITLAAHLNAEPQDRIDYNGAMARDAGELLRDALSLPAEARAALIDSLIESLDIEVDENAEEAWREEICRRLQQIDGGAVKLLPWDDAQRRLRTRLRP